MDNLRTKIASLLIGSDFSVPTEQRKVLDVLQDDLTRNWNAWGEEQYYYFTGVFKTHEPSADFILKWVERCRFEYFGFKENELLTLFTDKYEKYPTSQLSDD